MRFIIAILILLNVPSVFSQQIKEPYDTHIYVTGLTKAGTGYWASGGSDLCIAGNGTNGFVNPSCTGLKKRMVYAEFGKWSGIDYVEDIQMAGQTIIPAYISFSMPYKKSVLSLGFCNYYDSKMTIRLELTSIDNPEGTGEYLEDIERHKYSLFFGSLGHSLNRFISVGMTLGLSLLNENDRICYSDANGTGFGYSFIAGVTFSSSNDVSLGFVIRYFSDIKYEVVMENFELLDPTDMDPEIYGNNANIRDDVSDNRFKFHAKFPFEIETGISHKVSQRVILSGKIGIQEWINEENQNIDIVNYHCGARIRIADPVGISLGYFTQDDPRKDTKWLSAEGSNKFLTLGAQIKPVQFLNLSLNYLDSKLLATKGEIDNSPRYFSMGIAVQF